MEMDTYVVLLHNAFFCNIVIYNDSKYGIYYVE